MNFEFEEKKLKDQKLLLSYDREDKIITSKEAWDSLEEIRNQPIVKFFSKIPSLDRMTDGFREGDLVVVSGITKQGKTSFCQTLTTNFSQQDISCLWFSYEMSLIEFLQKFKPELPFFTLPSMLKESSIKWMEERIVESMAKYGTKIVFIDHLHFLLGMNQLGIMGNVSLIIGGIMRELKKIALYRQICIILVAHTTKLHFDQEPDLSSIRDSSFIGQEADIVLMIWRRIVKREMTNEARLSVLANRRTGQNGKINLLFNQGVFQEETKTYEQDNSE
jgi:replicative DNA helicase